MSKLNSDEVKAWMIDNLVMREEARKITGQSDSAFGQSLGHGYIQPFIEYGNKRKMSLYLKKDLEEYARNKKK